MKFDFEKFKQSLLDNETITTDEMELTIKLVNEYIKENYNVLDIETSEDFISPIFANNEDFITINKKCKNIKLINTDLRFNIEQGNLLNITLRLFNKSYRRNNLIEYTIDCNDIDLQCYYYSENEYLQDVETLRKVFQK